MQHMNSWEAVPQGVKVEEYLGFNSNIQGPEITRQGLEPLH